MAAVTQKKQASVSQAERSGQDAFDFALQERRRKASEQDREEFLKDRARALATLTSEAGASNLFVAPPASVPTASQATFHPPYAELFTKFELISAIKFKCQRFADGTSVDTAVYSDRIEDVHVTRSTRNATSPNSGKTYKFKTFKFEVIYSDRENGSVTLIFDDQKLPVDEAGSKVIGVRDLWASRVTYPVSNQTKR